MPLALQNVGVEQRGLTYHIVCSLGIWSDWSLQVFQSGAQVSVRRYEDAPPELLWALLFEIRDPLDSMSEGTGWHRENKFKSWAVPIGIYTRGISDETQ